MSLRAKHIFFCLIFSFLSLVLIAQEGFSDYENYSDVASKFKEIDFSKLSDSAKSLYILNKFQIDFNSGITGDKDFRNSFDFYTDSARYYAKLANCRSCENYIQLLKVNYYSDNNIILDLPKLPAFASKKLQLHYYCTAFLLDFKRNDSVDLRNIREINRLVFDTSISILQRIAVSDLVATYFYYQQGDLKSCEKLFDVAIEAYENDEFSANPWKMQRENPGIYMIPIQKVSRSYLNSGLIAEKQGNYDKALKNMIKGAELYSIRKDTMGVLWAYRDLSKAFAFQRDIKNCSKYVDSTLKILKYGSEKLLRNKAERLSSFLLEYYELIQNPLTKDTIILKIKELFPNYKQLTSDERNMAHQVHIRLIALASFADSISPQDLKNLESNILSMEIDSSQIRVYVNNLQNLIAAEFWTLKAKSTDNFLERKQAQAKYKEHWENLSLDQYKRNYYLFSKNYLQQLKDQSFLLKMNAELSKAEWGSSFANLNYMKDRFLAWEEIGQWDSALYYHKIYSNFKDSLVNRDNYIKLAQSDLELKSLETQRLQDELKLESYSNKQRFLISAILAITFFFLTILFQQIRKREKIKNEKNAELLQLRAESESQKNQILQGQNKQLEKELHTSILETIHNQSRNIELGEILEELKAGSESLFVDRKAKEMKRKLNEFSAQEALLDIEKSAAQLSPHLYDFLLEKLSKRNKMELMLCLMLVMNYSTEDIARLLNRSEKAIKSLRYRVRKRLELKENQDLTEYLKQFSNQKIKS